MKCENSGLRCDFIGLNGNLGQCTIHEQATGAGRERDWRLPEERFADEGLKDGSVGAGGEEGEQSAGSHQLCGGGNGSLHVVDGAEGDAVEADLQFLCAGAVDLYLDGKCTDGLAEEGGFLVLGFGEGDGDLGTEDGDGQAWEAGPGTEVEEGVDVCWQGSGTEDGLKEVAAEYAFFLANGSEVGAGVPFLEEGQVGGEPLRGFRVQRIGARLNQESIEAIGGGGHVEIVGWRHGTHSELMSAPRFSANLEVIADD